MTLRIALLVVALAQVTITLTPAQQDTLRAVLSALLPAPTPPPPTGASIAVPAGGDIQKALDTVADGGTVALVPGVTYTTNLVFKKRAGAVTLRGLDDATVPPGVRVTPATAAVMPKLVCADCQQPVIAAAFGAHDITIIGLDVLGLPDRATIAFNVDTNSAFAPTLADQPSNVTLDRLSVHADAGGRLGVRLDGRTMAVLNSDIRGFRYANGDAQAVAVAQGAGPFRIVNNYLEASGENFMAGGDDPVIQGLIPSDITFTDNTCFKPLTWKGLGSVKNLFELKNAQRVKVEHNVFENNWKGGQPGSAIVITVRNQDGRCPWCVVKDVVFANNIVKNNPDNFAVNILGKDDAQPSGIASSIVIANNLFLTVAKGVQVLVPLNGLELAHNTFVGITGQFLAFGVVSAGATVTGLNVHDNVSSLGAYGITGDGTSIGTPSLTPYAPGFQFVKNLLEASVERTIPLPAGNYVLAPKTLAGKLDALFRVTDPAYVASDGGLVGVDVAKLPK